MYTKISTFVYNVQFACIKAVVEEYFKDEDNGWVM